MKYKNVSQKISKSRTGYQKRPPVGIGRNLGIRNLALHNLRTGQNISARWCSIPAEKLRCANYACVRQPNLSFVKSVKEQS